MSRQEPPVNPNLGKSFLESLKEEFPDEFQEKPPTLRKQLKDMDQIIAVEVDYLDNPDPSITGVPESEEDEAGRSLSEMVE